MTKKITTPIFLTLLSRKIFFQYIREFSLERARCTCSIITQQKGLITCLFVLLSIAQSGLQAQSCTISGDVTEPDGTLLHAGGVALDGTETPFTLPTSCPPADNDAVINNRGFMIGCNQPDCPTSTTPTSSEVPMASCPLFNVTYREVAVPENKIFIQYWNDCVGSTLPTNYRASYQGFANQIFCELDANGYPMAPAAAGTPLSGLITTLPTRTEDIPAMVTDLGSTANCSRNNTKEAELIQADFWVVIPSFVKSLGVQFSGPRDDNALFMVGPNLNEMCATADFVSSSGGDQGIERLYYDIPSTATKVCGGTLLRARLYISDIADQFSVGPQFDFGNGFTDVGDGVVYPATSAVDNTPPTLQYVDHDGDGDVDGDDVLSGFRDADGNIYDSNMDIAPNGCFVAEGDLFDMCSSMLNCMISGPTSTCTNTTGLTYSGVTGATSYAWIVTSGDATIVGAANQQMVTVNAGATDFTLQLMISPGTVTTCTYDVTVNPLPTCSIAGSNMVVENTQDVTYMGPAGMMTYAWSVIAGDADIDGANDEQNVNIDFGTSNSTLQLTITDMNGCMATCTQVVTMTSSLTCMISGPTSTCANTTGLTFSGIAGATSYAWTVATGDATIVGAADEQMVTVNAGATDFTLQLMISPGAVTTCTYDVTVNPLPTCSITGAAIALENAQDIQYSGPAGMMTYAWSVIAGDVVIDGVSNEQNVNIDFGTSNSTLQLTITDMNGCMTTCTQVVTTIFPLTCMTSGPTSTCTNTEGLIFSGVAGASSYAWTVATGDATIVGPANQQMVTVNAGATDFTLQLVISPGTVTSCTHTVTVNPLPTCSITGSSMEVENTNGSQYMGPAGMMAYAWSVIGGDAVIDGASNGQNVSINFGKNNSTLQLTITDANGCMATCTDNVTIEKAAPLNYTWSFLDPCNCGNPDNITLPDGTFLNADFIRVDASQYTNPVVTLAFADANFLDNTGNPIVAATASFTALGGGIFQLPYYVRSNRPTTFTIDVNGDQQSGSSSVSCNCDPVIPTMSQWGLIIFGLLILNLGIFFLYRKELLVGA